MSFFAFCLLTHTWICSHSLVSYEEFKKMFNQRKMSSKNVIYDAIEDDEGDEVDDGLVGLDAKIPGGKFDVDK